MSVKRLWGIALALALLAAARAPAADERGAVSCEQLNWSPQVLAANPDIGRACRGVFQKDDVLYALAKIEVVRAQANTLRFRTLRTDGSKGPQRSIKLPPDFRVVLDGRKYRIGELLPGQELNVFLPEDRFALVLDSADDGAPMGSSINIEQ